VVDVEATRTKGFAFSFLCVEIYTTAGTSGRVNDNTTCMNMRVVTLLYTINPSLSQLQND
jgi:hypothetical protein